MIICHTPLWLDFTNQAKQTELICNADCLVRDLASSRIVKLLLYHDYHGYTTIFALKVSVFKVTEVKIIPCGLPWSNHHNSPTGNQTKFRTHSEAMTGCGNLIQPGLARLPGRDSNQECGEI